MHYAHETAVTIQIDSLLVSLIFRKLFKTGSNSHEKVVPSLVFNVDRNLRERYLVAYLAGDGYPSKEFTEHLVNNTSPGLGSRAKFTAASASNDLIDGLSYLLFSLGKTFSIGEINKERRGEIRLNYHGRIKKVKMEKLLKAERLDFYWNDNSSYLDRIPVQESISNISWERPYSFSLNTHGGVTRSKISTLLKEGRIGLYSGISQFLQSDLGILKVVKIERVNYKKPWVYDFSVPGGENFVGGFAPIAVHNSFDEAMAGFAKTVTIELLPDNKVSVLDDGRGIPVEMHKQTKKSALETVMTTLHAGGKFGGESYKVAGGLHGVGVSVVNALSNWLRVEVCREGALYAQEYKRGKPTSGVKKIGKCDQTGTKVIFSPDPEVFKEISFSDKKIVDHLRQQAYLTKGVRINFFDRRNKIPKFYGFYFEGGLLSFVKYLSRNEKPLQENIFYVHKEQEEIEVEVAFLYMDDLEIKEYSFANNIYTPDGGMHLTGFRSALTRGFNNYARSEKYLKEKDENFTSDDTREGLTVVVSVKLREPQFEGQTKARLGNPEARTAVESVVGDGLKEFFEKKPADGRKIIEKALLAAKARKAAKAAKDTVLRKGALDGLTLPGKLADCTSKSPEESELFIVEGDSAGGCFSGDTKVALADGRSLTFRELVEEDQQGKTNFCYSIKEDGSVGLARISNPRITRKKTKVLRVILDNDEEMLCTPDHKFMFRDGSYREAGSLKLNDSLMPLYRKHSKIGGRITIDGYEMVFNGDRTKLSEAVINYNHKVKKVIEVSDRIDVYDLEVADTHNFALASGVFVHNSAKAGRDRRIQAILPLRGKILNVEKARLDKMLGNQEIRSLVMAIGTAIAEEFDISNIRYHKIVIMTDADVDGAHIRTLLLTLFFRYFRQVIEEGYLYIAQPPLYRVSVGKNVQYVYSDSQKDKVVMEMQKAKNQKLKAKTSEQDSKTESDEEGGESDSASTKGVNIQRYKGLGEMNPDQLWETTMNPANRVLKKVIFDDAKEAERMFDVLMGDEVAPRRKFIELHALSVKNLDI